jgi:hypothetical protein
MKSWFQPKEESGNTAFRGSNQPHIHLAAFGKHPGWEDHIPGIGLRTEGLAQVKQVFYVAGIGGQIDSGAWKKMEQDKRLPGFDHWFLWRRAGAIYCGRLWSSQDRGGRKEYPMVLCVESTQIAANTLLAKAWPELDRLHEVCQRADSAITVTAECGAAEARLRQALTDPSATGLVESQVKRSFLDHASLGPDRLGWLRVVHEMNRFLDPDAHRQGSTSFDPSQSQHWRVPLGCQTEGGALLLWFEFLGKAVPAAAPLLLLTRAGSGWVEVIAGEPHTDDFFCLQASGQSLPLATEIPYEQHWEPETAARVKARFTELEARFLGEARPEVGSKPEPRRPATPQAMPAQTDTPKPRRSWWMVLVIVLLLLVGAPLAWWAATGGMRSRDAAVEATPGVEADQPTQAAASAREAEAQQKQAALAKAEKDYQSATNASGLALRQKDYPAAVRHADLALAIKPADAAATSLKAEAQQGQAAMAKAEQDYRSATNAAGVALSQKDYAEAVRQTDMALGLKPGDAAATALKAQVQQGQAAMTQAEGDYQAATNAAGVALRGKNFSEAVQQADLALGLKPGDATASSLKAQAQQGQAALAQAEQAYQSATNAAGVALAQNDFTEALRQVDLALAARPGDAAATGLRAQAQKLQAEAATRLRYTQAITDARSAFDGGDYATAIKQATLALDIRKNDPEAAALKSEAERLRKERLAAQQYETVMQDGRAALDRKDHATALQRATEALQLRPGDDSAANLKSKAIAGSDLQRATEFFTAGEYEKALALCASHPGDASFAALSKAIEEKKAGQSQQQLAALDLEFQKLLVKFNVLSAKDDYIQSPEAREEPRLGGRIGPDGVDYYLAAADRLEAGFAQAGVLRQNERETYLKKLRAAIPRWQ